MIDGDIKLKFIDVLRVGYILGFWFFFEYGFDFISDLMEFFCVGEIIIGNLEFDGCG